MSKFSDFFSCDGEIRVAVIGDSMTTTNTLIGPSATDILERRLQHMGRKVTIFPCGRDGHTFYRANTVAFKKTSSTSGLKTSAEAAVEANPHFIFIPLGINDSLLNVDGRTLAQQKTDADTLISYLVSNAPQAQILYFSQKPYDSTKFTPATCKNKGMPVYFHVKKATGILTGCYSSEILEDLVSSTTQTNLANWVALDTYIKANVQLLPAGDINLFKVCRLGGAGNDGVHLNPGGTNLVAGYMLEGLRTISTAETGFWGLITNAFDWWEKPDYVFSQLLVASEDGYVFTNDITSVNQNLLSGDFLRTTTWNFPLKASNYVLPVGTLVDNGASPYCWQIAGAAPFSLVSVSVNGAAFASTGVSTNACGNAMAVTAGSDMVASLAIGANTLRYKVGDIIFGPTTLTLAAYVLPWVAPTLVNSWAAVFPGTYSPVGYYVDKFKCITFRGIINGGTAGSVFMTLPAGLRPPYTVFIATASGTSVSNIQVNPNGDCIVTGAVSNVSLEGVSFTCA